MPRGTTALLVVLLGVAAVGLLVWTTLPGETVLRETPTGPRAISLAATFDGHPFSHDHSVQSCEICHYAWVIPFAVNATREDPAPEVASTYAVRVAPVSGYEVAAAFAAPRTGDDGLPRPLETRTTVQVGAQGATVPLTLPWPVGAVLVEAWNADPYKRPDLRLTLSAGAAGSAAGEGGRANKHALLAAASEGPLTGPVTATVTVADVADALTEVVVRFRAFPEGYQVVANATRGAPAAFQWTLPPPGAAGAPERFHVAVVVFNDHPTDKWRMPLDLDRAYYEGNVSASEARAPLLPRVFSAQELEDPWEGGDSVLLYEERFDGVRVYHHNARGEWTRTGRAVSAQVPEEAPFPALPPGTTHVRATLTWEKRTPLSPDPPFHFAYSQRPLPDFRYPEPFSVKSGERVDIVPISPEEWEATETGWFQAFYLLRIDQDGKAFYDGAHHYRLEAMRGPVPVKGG